MRCCRGQDVEERGRVPSGTPRASFVVVLCSHLLLLPPITPSSPASSTTKPTCTHMSRSLLQIPLTGVRHPLPALSPLARCNATHTSRQWQWRGPGNSKGVLQYVHPSVGTRVGTSTPLVGDRLSEFVTLGDGSNTRCSSIPTCHHPYIMPLAHPSAAPLSHRISDLPLFFPSFSFLQSFCDHG